MQQPGAFCAICIDTFNKEITTVRCGHVFHTSCIEEWMLHADTCPYCRTTILPEESPEYSNPIIQRLMHQDALAYVRRHMLPSEIIDEYIFLYYQNKISDKMALPILNEILKTHELCNEHLIEFCNIFDADEIVKYQKHITPQMRHLLGIDPTVEDFDNFGSYLSFYQRTYEYM
jgi:hypothetical protein